MPRRKRRRILSTIDQYSQDDYFVTITIAIYGIIITYAWTATSWQRTWHTCIHTYIGSRRVSGKLKQKKKLNKERLYRACKDRGSRCVKAFVCYNRVQKEKYCTYHERALSLSVRKENILLPRIERRYRSIHGYLSFFSFSLSRTTNEPNFGERSGKRAFIIDIIRGSVRGNRYSILVLLV